MVPRGLPFAILFCAKGGHFFASLSPAAEDEAVASSAGGPLAAYYPCKPRKDGPSKDVFRELGAATRPTYPPAKTEMPATGAATSIHRLAVAQIFIGET